MIDLLRSLPMLQVDTGNPYEILTMIVPIGIIIVVFYFLIIRPQNKKNKALQNMISSIKKGDKIVTIGGIHGTVTSVKEQSVIVKVDTDTTMEFTKNAVSSVLTDSIDGKSDEKNKSSK